MKISLEWLADYVAWNGDAEALSEALTDGGTEVIGVESKGNVPDKIVVAQILSSEQHPNADRLSVCKVDDGSGEPRQIVCGARNYKVGDKVPLALPGAVLGPDFKIKSGKLRGVASEGMMCSAKELALAEDADGLLILSQDAQVGQPVSELFKPETIFELEVTPNRPDMLSYLGAAREVSALTGAELKGRAKAHQVLPVSRIAGDHEVRIEDDGCAVYSARTIRDVKVLPSPSWLADRLVAAGLRPINNVVDVTNYVMLETGQPLHAFDLQKLSGGIIVRKAIEGEKLQALDGTELVLRSQDMVIADEARALALAGVMGGEETSVTDGTVDILLESAWFESARVQKTSRELGISSDSSYRFERRVNPEGMLAASARAVELILELAGGSAESEVLVAGSVPDTSREVVLDNDQCRGLLGLEISDEEIAEILLRLGLEKLPSGAWKIPASRPDLTRGVDLIEEVIRVAGIERVPSKLRGFPAETTNADRRHDRAEVLRGRLRTQGFSEARTSHFVSADLLARAGADAAAAIAIRNPLGADQALLRPTLRAGLLGALAHNLRHGAKSVRLFELGRIFMQDANEERTVLALIACGEASEGSWNQAAESAEIHDLKGVLEVVLGKISMTPLKTGTLSLEIRGEDGVSGILQRLPKSLAREFDARQPVYYAEVQVGGWLEAVSPEVRVRHLPKFPSVERDMSLILPKVVAYAEVEKLIRSAKVKNLVSFALKDVFEDRSGKALAPDKRTLTVGLTFRADERTLTSDETEQAVEELRARAKSELGAEFRS